jgi:SecD/SecF fusion protein
VQAAIDNSYNVLRTRIDRFGVVQPNIQSLEGSMGRIMVEQPGIKEPERVRKLLQGSANLEFWETYTAKDAIPYVQAADQKLRTILSSEQSETTEDTTATAQAQPVRSTADSLAAALRGETAAQAADLAQYKKEHPLLAILQLNSSGQGPVVGYANYKDTADINRYLAMREEQASLPRDMRLKWGVSAMGGAADPKAQIFELYGIRSSERNGRAPLEGDVIVDAKNDYDQHGNPSVSMTMNTDGARRWAQLTKQNVNKAIAIVLDGYVYSAPNVMAEITGGNSQITGNFTPEQTKD